MSEDYGKLVDWLSELVSKVEAGKKIRPCAKALCRTAAALRALEVERDEAVAQSQRWADASKEEYERAEKEFARANEAVAGLAALHEMLGRELCANNGIDPDAVDYKGRRQWHDLAEQAFPLPATAESVGPTGGPGCTCRYGSEGLYKRDQKCPIHSPHRGQP